MLEIVAIFAVYALLQKLLIDKALICRIKKAASAEEAILCRAKLKFRRRVFLFAYLGLLVCVFTWLSLLAIDETGKFDVNDWRWVVTLPVFLYSYLVSGKNLERLVGNLSTLDKRKFLAQAGDYALYLRGFETDDYTPESKYLARAKKDSSRWVWRKRKNVALSFSEYYFTRALQSKIPVCAVGMTKEIEAPVGASRVYLNDSSWKEDVRELMECAKEIYILVNDRPSCVWEIEQSLGMLSKTIFLIDDRCRYMNVRELWSTKGYALPSLPVPAHEYPLSDFVAIRFDKEDVTCKSYEKSVVGYSKLLGVPVPPRKRSRTGCGCICTVLLSLVILFMIVYFVQDSESKIEQEDRDVIAEYKASQKCGAQLPEEIVFGTVRILPPENSVEVMPKTELFARLDMIDSGMTGVKCERRYYRNHLPEENDFLVSGTLDVISITNWEGMTFSPGTFRRQMELERKSMSPGAILRNERRKNIEFNGLIYDDYNEKLTVVNVSDISASSFSYSLLAEEELVSSMQTQIVHTATTIRFILVDGSILMLRARDVSRDKNAVYANIMHQDLVLKQWGRVIRAYNAQEQRNVAAQKSAESSSVDLGQKKEDNDEEKAQNHGTGLIVPLILVIVMWFVLRRLWRRYFKEN